MEWQRQDEDRLRVRHDDVTPVLPLDLPPGPLEGAHRFTAGIRGTLGNDGNGYFNLAQVERERQSAGLTNE